MTKKADDRNAGAAVLLDEGPVGFAEAARKLAGLGRVGTSIIARTLTRWAVKGMPLPGGGRLKLECLRIGKNWFTSVPAVMRFLDRYTAAHVEAGDEKPADMPRSKAERDRAFKAAEKTLDEMGV